MTLSRSELLAANKRRYVEVNLPTGGAVRLQNLTAQEMRSFRASLTDAQGELLAVRSERLQELLLARCLVDEEGNRLFTDDDVFAGVLDDLDGAVLAAMYRSARLHTGFASDHDFSAVEQAVKNSQNGQSSCSPV